MKKKISAILLAALLGASAFVACGKEGGNTGNNDTSSSSQTSSEDRNYVDGGTFTDQDPHYVSAEKLTHDVTITEVGRPFVVDGVTEYSIVLGTKDGRAADAANFLRQQVSLATGGSVSIIIDGDQDLKADGLDVNNEIVYTPMSKYIVIDHQKLEQEAAIEWRNDVDLEYSGYMIKSMDDSVFMKTNSFFGYQKVVQAFLREIIGYEWYSYDTIVYTKDGATLPDMDIVEKPDFDLTWNSGYMASSSYMASPITKEQVFAFINGNFCHNSFDFIPTSNYQAHPDWFAHEAAQGSLSQLCYTAHGNKEEYDAMLKLAFEGVMKCLESNPNAATITFTRQDEHGNCVCSTCGMLQNLFHDSLASTYMFFVNDLDTMVQEELQRIADEKGEPKREVTVLFFAYRETSKAPVGGTDGNYTVPKMDYVEKADGTKVNIVEYKDEIIELPFNRTYENGLECNEHVGVFYAPIDAYFEENFYHKDNKEYKETFEKWGLLSDRLYCWIYDTNFTRYVVPYNSYCAIPETLRFLKDAGGAFLFNQGDRENGIYTGFGTLRTYLTYTLSQNVNLDEGVLVDKFFENYFREAAPFMREYYNMLVAHMERLEIDYPAIFHTQRRTNSEEPKYWDFATLESWLKLCDQAKTAILKYKTSDPILYESLYKHIVAETIFPNYMKCEYYYGYYNPAVANAMRISFMEDCNLIGYKAHAEQIPIKPWFQKWDLIP